MCKVQTTVTTKWTSRIQEATRQPQSLSWDSHQGMDASLARLNLLYSGSVAMRVADSTTQICWLSGPAGTSLVDAIDSAQRPVLETVPRRSAFETCRDKWQPRRPISSLLMGLMNVLHENKSPFRFLLTRRPELEIESRFTPGPGNRRS